MVSTETKSNNSAEQRKVWALGPERARVEVGLWDANKVIAELYGENAATAVSVTLGTYGDERVALIGMKSGDAAPNEWNADYTGVLYVAAEPDSTLTEAEVAEIVKKTDDTHKVWIYPADTGEPVREASIGMGMAVHAICAMFCGADTLGDENCCGSILGIEQTSGEGMIVMGRTEGRDEDKNGWAIGMYGPVVVTGGREGANQTLIVTDVEGAVARSFMERIKTLADEWNQIQR